MKNAFWPRTAKVVTMCGVVLCMESPALAQSTTRVSVSTGGAQAAGGAAPDTLSAMSNGGRYVVFVSTADGLVSGDSNGRADVFVRDLDTGSTTLVSRSSSGVAPGTASTAGRVGVSSDGRYIVYADSSSQIVPNDTNATTDIFRFDRVAGATTRISVSSAGAQATGESSSPSIDASGLFVAFVSSANNLVTGDTGASDVFLRNVATGQTTRLSIGVGGAQPNGSSGNAVISGNGRYVVFESTATNLVAGDTNGVADVFLYDRQSGVLSRVSVSSAGVQATEASSRPGVSNDGRFVVFESRAGNLVSGDTNNARDVFVRDTVSGQTTRVSVATGGSQSGVGGGVTGAGRGSLSSDGRYVVFQSDAGDVVGGDQNDMWDVFLRDRQTDTTMRLSVSSTGQEGNGSASAAAIDASGLRVVFSSSATNLLPDDANNLQELFTRTVASAATLARVEVNPAGVPASGRAATGYSWAQALSGDGRYVAFVSHAANLVQGDRNGLGDVFIHDRATQSTTRISLRTQGRELTQAAAAPAISGDGRYVAYVSASAGIVASDSNGESDVFVYDRSTGVTELVSISSSGAQLPVEGATIAMNADGSVVVFNTNRTYDGHPAGIYVRDRKAGTTSVVSVGANGAPANSTSFSAAVSDDGKLVAFYSYASNLATGDSGSDADVFVYNRQTGAMTRVSRGLGGQEPNGSAYWPEISGDGRVVVFVSDASNLVNNDTNGVSDAFAYDLETGTTTRVSVDSSGTQADGVIAGELGISRDGRFVLFGSAARSLGVTGGAALFTHDRRTGATVRVSASSGGGYPGDSANGGVLSGDGSTVAFYSSGSSWVRGDTNGELDVFVRSLDEVFTFDFEANPASPSFRQGAVTSVNATEGRLTMSVTRESGERFDVSTAVAGIPTGFGSRTLDPMCCATSAAGFVLTFSEPVLGATVDIATSVGVGRQVYLTAFAGAGLSGPTVGESSVLMPTGGTGLVSRTLSLSSEAPFRSIRIGGAPGAGNVFLLDNVRVVAVTDRDADGLPDWWEGLHGISTMSGAGDSGPHGDLDGDGLTNAQEFAGGTHPNGTVKRYLAEGATIGMFSTSIALLNPTTQPASASLRFLKTDGSVVPYSVGLPPRQRVTVTPELIGGLSDAEFSTVIEADQSVVVDRTMTWDAATGYGAHAETAVSFPTTTWYFAEGSTNAGFEMFYLLQNPTDAPATVRVRYLLTAGAPIEKQYQLAPNSRTNIWVNEEEFPAGSGNKLLADADISAVIESTNGVPIIAERAVYLSNQGRLFNAGHESAGVTAPATQWFLAEGATGAYFDLFVLVANPSAQAAQLRITYLLPNGTTYTRDMTAPASSRSNIWVDEEQFPGVGKALADTAVSTTVESLNNVPIIVERALWWPGTFATWHEAHNSPGSTSTGTTWASAEGEVGGSRQLETYFLIANTSSFAGNARVTLFYEDGSSNSKNFSLPARSRTNVQAQGEFPGSVGRRFSALIESLGSTPAQVVVERAMYSNAGGVTWAAGTNSLAARIQ